MNARTHVAQRKLAVALEEQKALVEIAQLLSGGTARGAA